jgi:hypothetical protein
VSDVLKYGMDQNAIQDLINLPETGMGFQIVEASISNRFGESPGC